MTWAKRTDANHQTIMAALRQLGWRVADTSRQGGGFPDLVIYKVGNPIRLIEVKERGGVLTRDQEAFMAEGWPVTIVRSVDDVVNL